MRKTKIVATIGPACESKEMIKRMVGAGVDVFRFNMKHNDLEWHSSKMELVEKLCEEMGERVGMLIDLQGPEIRIDSVPEKWSTVEPGDVIRFCKPGKDGIVLDHPEIFADIQKGQQIYADDGFLEFEVTQAEDDWVEARVIEGGQIKLRKTANFPGMHLSFQALIDRDIQHLSLAARHHVDFVALSFVRSIDDVQLLRKELDKHDIQAKIISKIEHPEGVENFFGILEESDGIMVARGDLGIEYPMEEVPALQKMMVKKCQQAGKPVIIATQMMESMIENPRPTRAEVSDVANAVYDGTDAIMLSAESAAGAYPVRAVKTMARIAMKAEQAVSYAALEINWDKEGQTAAVVAAANTLAQCSYQGACDLRAFVVLTESGKTAEYLARMRPRLPLLALSKDTKVLDQLKLVWGVEPVHFDYAKDPHVDVESVMDKLKEIGRLHEGDKAVMIHGEVWGKSGYSSVVRVQEVV